VRRLYTSQQIHCTFLGRLGDGDDFEISSFFIHPRHVSDVQYDPGEELNHGLETVGFGPILQMFATPLPQQDCGRGGAMNAGYVYVYIIGFYRK
jgi:hypothetical protein